VVSTSFKRVVNDATKDVLLYVYATWCNHCQEFAPVYAKMAKELGASQPNLLLTKFDGEANDIPFEYKMTSYPTLFLVPANNKNKPITYKGKREPEEIKKFLKQHASASFKKTKEEL